MRWRPLTWALLSVLCFVAAYYAWRLGDQWAAKTGRGERGERREQTNAWRSVAPASAAASVTHHASLVTNASFSTNASLSSSASTLPSTNRFAYRLTNTTKTMAQLARSENAILLKNALFDTTQPVAPAIPDQLRSL